VKRRRLNVLAVINSLRIGGAERMLERLVTRAHESGTVRFTVCSLEDLGPVGARFRSKGIDVVALGGRGGSIRTILRGILGLRELLRGGEFDIIYSTLYRSHCASRLARWSLGSRLPLISHEHCLGDNRSRLVLRVNRLTAGLSDRILTVSDSVRETVIRRDRVPPEKVFTVPNGIECPGPDERARRRLRRALGVADRETVLLYVGRLHHEKGPDILLRALGSMAAESDAPWRGVIVGDGPERLRLQQMAEEFGLRERLMFAGFRSPIGPWFDAGDLFVLPSREEGMPVAALEAMGKAKAVVATAVGGTPEVVVDRETGLLVPPEDPRGLAVALRSLVVDAGLRETLGRRGMSRVASEFSVDHMLRYEECRSSAGRQRNHGLRPGRVPLSGK
jgi:glycosyltransferase involved in cell wall biosynthesis